MRSFVFALVFALSALSVFGATLYESLQTNNFTEVVSFLDDPKNVAYKELLSNTTFNTTIFAPLVLSENTTSFSYLLVSGNVDTTKFAKGLLIETEFETALNFKQKAEFSAADMVQGATIANKSAIEADNGAIIEVDVALAVPSSSVAELATATPDLSDLLSAVLRGKYASEIAGQVTVFAPTNDAWGVADLRVKYLASDAASEDDLKIVLSYHVSPDLYYSAEGAKTITTKDSARTVDVTSVNGTAKYGDATITAVDILANNGVVHLIDAVQIPDNFVFTARAWFSTQDDYKNFVAACAKFPAINALLDSKTPITILAPPDAKFTNDNKTTAAELQYYFISGTAELTTGLVASLLPLGNNFQQIQVTKDGDKITVKGEDSAEATKADTTNVPNTLVYTLDDELEAPDDDLEDAIEDAKLKQLEDLLDILPKTSAFYAAVLGENATNVTVFGPADSAFGEIPQPYINILTDVNDTTHLETVLDQHVVRGVYFAADLLNMDGHVFTTIGGDKLTVSIDANKTTVSLVSDDASSTTAVVTTANALADNGVAHVIDTVLVPATFKVDAADLLVEGLGAETLFDSLNRTGLLTDAKYNLTTGDYLVFAPTDDAFDNLKNTTALTSNNTDGLKDLLLKHIVPRTVNLTAGLKNGTCYETLTANVSLCVSATDEFKKWAIYLDSKDDNDDKVDITGPEGTANVTALVGYATIPTGNTWVYSIDGVLGEAENKKKSGLGSTEIGLIVAGCIVAVLLAGAAVGGAVWYYRKNSNKDYTEL